MVTPGGGTPDPGVLLAFKHCRFVHTTQTTWSTLHASTYWNMRLSVAGAAKDAQVQNDILLSDFM